MEESVSSSRGLVLSEWRKRNRAKSVTTEAAYGVVPCQDHHVADITNERRPRRPHLLCSRQDIPKSTPRSPSNKGTRRRSRRRAPRPRPSLLTSAAVLLYTSVVSQCALAQNSQCLTADAMIGGMRHYIQDWDRQLSAARNESWTCEDFAHFLYNSRDRIAEELRYT